MAAFKQSSGGGGGDGTEKGGEGEGQVGGRRREKLKNEVIF